MEIFVILAFVGVIDVIALIYLHNARKQQIEVNKF